MMINLDFEWLNLSQLMANLLKHRAKTQPDREHQRLTLPYIVLYSNSIRCLWLFVREQSNVIIALESHPKKQITRSIIIYENCFDSPIHFFSHSSHFFCAYIHFALRVGERGDLIVVHTRNVNLQSRSMF